MSETREPEVNYCESCGRLNRKHTLAGLRRCEGDKNNPLGHMAFSKMMRSE